MRTNISISGSLMLLTSFTLTKVFQVLNDRVCKYLHAGGKVTDLSNFQSNFFLTIRMVQIADNNFHIYLGMYSSMALLHMLWEAYMTIMHLVHSDTYTMTEVVMDYSFMFYNLLLWFLPLWYTSEIRVQVIE